MNSEPGDLQLVFKFNQFSKSKSLISDTVFRIVVVLPFSGNIVINVYDEIVKATICMNQPGERKCLNFE